MSENSDLQAKFTFATVIIGIVFLLIIFLVTVIVFKDSEKPAETIVAVLGVVTGVLGTLVGYVAGQAGKEKAEQRASKAERQLTAVIDKTGQGTLEQARKAYPDLFKD
jgi:energy-coupling factor transporter transmembrane protein EcfT